MENVQLLQSNDRLMALKSISLSIHRPCTQVIFVRLLDNISFLFSSLFPLPRPRALEMAVKGNSG